MAQKHRFSRNKNKPQSSRPRASEPAPAPRIVYEPKPPTQYGKPFVLLEDGDKNTFEYAAGAWIPYGLTIAQCRREDCLVKELPQKVNGKSRYEVRCPLPT
ncbi:MAG TPA: hypothetical protein VMJ32_10745 [Pirellulales bacterium]|nr:hypothetical protein [Pirellulales bacterium]